MKIRTAILLAANRIAKHPDLFRFFRCSVPADCGTPGCALGWISFYMGRGPRTRDLAPKELNVCSQLAFYERMDVLVGSAWSDGNAALTAKGLRLYADKYHPLKGAKT